MQDVIFCSKANQLANFPLNFLRTGYYSPSGALLNRRTNSYWWSTASLSETDAYNLNTNTTGIAPQYGYKRGNGFAMRWGGLPTTNTSDVPAKANQLANFPLNFLRTGYYFYDSGLLSYRASSGYWWSAIWNDATKSNAFGIGAESVYPQGNNTHGNGFARRWGAQGVKTLILTPLE